MLDNADILAALVGLIAAVIAASAARTGYRRLAAAAAERDRLAAHREWVSACSVPAAGTTTGRHHPPDALLGEVTYRLSAYGAGRAPVRGRRAA